MGRRIAVVGASTAGLLTAHRLASAGREVTVYERSANLDPEARSLIVTHRMKDLIGAVGDRSVRTTIDRFELFADGRVADFTLTEPDLIIERRTLIEDLAAAASDAGARFEFGHRFNDVKQGSHGLEVELDDGNGSVSEPADVVVGADGVSSRVARSAGWPQQPTVSLLQALVPLPDDYPAGTVRVWFRPHETPFFYWLIPDGPARGALGIIGESSGLRSHLDGFLDEKGFEPESYQAALVPAYKRWTDVRRRVGDGDVYLVGDAAGQVKVSTVGGVVTGFRGAQGVADMILGRNTNTLRGLRRELNVHLWIHKALRRFTQDDYCYLLDQFDDRVKRSMTVRSRDEAAWILASLLRSRPRMLLKGIRALLT